MTDAFSRFDMTLLPAAIVSGPGSRRAIAGETEALGLARLLVVASPSARKSSKFVDEVAQSLGGRLVAIHDKVEPNNPDTALTEIARVARDQRVDGVISIGGGAVHDTAKAIAVMAPSGHGILDFTMRFEPPATFHPPSVQVTPLPVFTVPTTFSAAEVLSGGAVTDTARQEKRIFFSGDLKPQRVFLDGEITASTPRAILAASGLNAIHHCLEALYSKARQPISDAFAIAALADLFEVLPAFSPDGTASDVSTVQRALNASAMSGLTYGNSGLGIGHAICHSLGGRYGLSHSAANAVIVRHSLRFNRDAAVSVLAKAARAVGAVAASDAAAADGLVARVDELTLRLKTPRTLRDIGLPEGQFSQLAEDAVADWVIATNPRSVSKDDVIRLLEAAW